MALVNWSYLHYTDIKKFFKILWNRKKKKRAIVVSKIQMSNPGPSWPCCFPNSFRTNYFYLKRYRNTFCSQFIWHKLLLSLEVHQPILFLVHLAQITFIWQKKTQTFHDPNVKHSYLHVSSWQMHPLTLSQTSPCFFFFVCSIYLLKTLWEKEKLLLLSYFSFSLCVFYPLW